ncbi:hypothetical protein VTK26DRAFT_6687 [Humicola hyalothermophila]
MSIRRPSNAIFPLFSFSHPLRIPLRNSPILHHSFSSTSGKPTLPFQQPHLQEKIDRSQAHQPHRDHLDAPPVTASRALSTDKSTSLTENSHPAQDLGESLTSSEALSAVDSASMDPNQRWGRPQPGAYVVQDPSSPFGMRLVSPDNCNPNRGPHAPQEPVPFRHQPFPQESGRSRRDRGDYWSPGGDHRSPGEDHKSSRGRRRRQRRRASPDRGAQEQRQSQPQVPLPPPRQGVVFPLPWGRSGTGGPGPLPSAGQFYQNDAFAAPTSGQTFVQNNSLPAVPPTRRDTINPPAPPPPTKRNSRRQPRPSARDPVSPPSAASGGVPEPTPAYLLRASLLPLVAPAKRPILVVIDLNGTLLHRPNKRSPSKFVERPHARAFLQSMIDKHHVVIWSSARPENVGRMCAQLLPPQYLSRVVAVWGRDRFGLTADDYSRRTQCYKRLTRLWSDPVVAASHPLARQPPPTTAATSSTAPSAPAGPSSGGTEATPLPPTTITTTTTNTTNPPAAAAAAASGGGEGGGGGGLGTAAAALGCCWNQGNTVLIDDSAEKARSEPHNAITLPEFAGDVNEQPQVLPLVEAYLDTLSWQMDVSTYIRARPFRM